MSIRDLTPWHWGSKSNLPESGDPLRFMRSRMDRLFDDMLDSFDVVPFVTGPNGSLFAPRIDVTETDKGYRFTAELPGVSEKDVDVSLTDNILTIKGEKKSESKKEEDGKVVRMERRFGSFQRSLSLPADVDAGKVDATFDKGVLTITVAKSKEAKAKTKKIEVKAA